MLNVEAAMPIRSVQVGEGSRQNVQVDKQIVSALPGDQ
jgi:hypothetical protein